MGKRSVNFRLARKDDRAELLIYDDIGESFFGGISAQMVADELKGLSVSALDVRINSQGGNVFDGFAIYNQLVRNKARVIVTVDGMALSAASLIAMAGDEIRIPENAWLMIHDPIGFAIGDATEMREQARLLDDIKASVVKVYADRTGIDPAEISDLMTEETWLDGANALARGFATEVIENLKIAAHVDAGRFTRIPERLAEATVLNNTAERRRERLAKMNVRALRLTSDEVETDNSGSQSGRAGNTGGTRN